MKGRLQEVALTLMPRAFAVEHPFPQKLRGHIAAATFLKGAVLPDEHLMQVLGMAEEHRAFRAEPEGDDITICVLETAHKAQHIAGKGQQMGPGNAGPGPGGDGVETIPSPSVEVLYLVSVWRHHGVGGPGPPEVTDAGDTASPARRGAVTSRGAHQARPLRGHHGRSVQSIQVLTAHVYSAREPRVALPPPPMPLPLHHPCHDRGHQTCTFSRHSPPLAARCQTSSSTRLSREHPDGTQRAPLEGFHLKKSRRG